jgi:hypothetical protein
MSRRDPVSFEFALLGPSGVLDLMMTLQYRGKTTAAPVIRYRALDRDGRPLPDVSVHSCYGTGHGEMALTQGENTDLLYLRGPSAHLTADVTGEIVELRPLDRKQNPVTQVIQNDEQGFELPSGQGFHHVTVVNPWSAEASCRVVAVALDAPESGPQGAVEVVSLTPDPVLVAGSSQVAVVPPAEAYAAISRYFGSSFVTVKTYPAGDGP